RSSHSTDESLVSYRALFFADSLHSRVAKPESFWHGARPLSNPSEAIQCKPLQVVVDGKGVERAIKHLKRKLAAEGLLRELKKRRHYMKPSIKKRKKIAEAARRRRKRDRVFE